VLSVIPADSEEHAVDIANDTIYGLNASVFTPDIARATLRAIARRSGHPVPSGDSVNGLMLRIHDRCLGSYGAVRYKPQHCRRKDWVCR
jgi:Aldehyde dehydrogenase family